MTVLFKHFGVSVDDCACVPLTGGDYLGKISMKNLSLRVVDGKTVNRMGDTDDEEEDDEENEKMEKEEDEEEVPEKPIGELVEKKKKKEKEKEEEKEEGSDDGESNDEESSEEEEEDDDKETDAQVGQVVVKSAEAEKGGYAAEEGSPDKETDTSDEEEQPQLIRKRPSGGLVVSQRYSLRLLNKAKEPRESNADKPIDVDIDDIAPVPQESSPTLTPAAKRRKGSVLGSQEENNTEETPAKGTLWIGPTQGGFAGFSSISVEHQLRTLSDQVQTLTTVIQELKDTQRVLVTQTESLIAQVTSQHQELLSRVESLEREVVEEVVPVPASPNQ